MHVSLPTFDLRSRRFSKTGTMLSLSRYFPAGTCYFYGYPSGEESGFLNHVPATVEELVAARPLACAGNDVKIIAFSKAVKKQTYSLVSSDLGSPLIPVEQIIKLPAEIDGITETTRRNGSIKQSLMKMVKPGTLVMAQPFLDEGLRKLYQISPRLTTWLNDKKNMDSYITNNFLPQRYATYQSGKEFAVTEHAFPFPCVIKVSSSSAGDGVHICKNKKTLQHIKRLLKNTKGAIFVEQYIEVKANYGIQFGIPHDPNMPIDIIGINQQLTTTEGEFVGGVIDNSRRYQELALVQEILLNHILPQIRELGWYGVGCFDVLTDQEDKPYIIDANFRMTGMTAYLMLAGNGLIKKPLVSFGGEYKGTLKDFQKIIKNISAQDTGKSKVHVLSLTESDGICRCNAAILFNTQDDIRTTARQLVDAGITSKALNFFC